MFSYNSCCANACFGYDSDGCQQQKKFQNTGHCFTIALAIFIAAVVGTIIVYCIDNVMYLYREHKRSQALGMRVLDIKVRLFFSLSLIQWLTDLSYRLLTESQILQHPLFHLTLLWRSFCIFRWHLLPLRTDSVPASRPFF